jgi:hypothetical protein
MKGPVDKIDTGHKKALAPYDFADRAAPDLIRQLVNVGRNGPCLIAGE